MKVIYTVIEKVEKNDYAQGGKIVNQRLEEVFNILPNEPEKKEELNNDIEDAIDNALVEYSAGMEITSKIDAALPIVSELNKHDEEMDDIHKKAIHTFTATDSVTETEHAGRTLLLGEVGGNANVVLTMSTKIIDVTGDSPIEYKGVVPARSVVIPGSYKKQFPAGEFYVPCAMIIGKRKESTNKKTSLNDALRENDVAV